MSKSSNKLSLHIGSEIGLRHFSFSQLIIGISYIIQSPFNYPQVFVADPNLSQMLCFVLKQQGRHQCHGLTMSLKKVNFQMNA